jgi:putative lipoic acid-binding regulatory protein
MEGKPPDPAAGLYDASGQPLLDEAQVDYPVTFDLRIIYILSQGATIVEDLERIYASLGIRCTLIQGIAAPGSKYGRMGSRVTMQSREQMYAAYEAIGKLPYVKTAL